MVGALSWSALVDLPAPVPVAGLSTDNNADNANANPGNVDRRKNIFPVERCTHGGMGQDGWWDEEDRGIYGLDCMHEIWSGVCSRRGREYPGHVDDDDDDDEADDDEDGDGNGGNQRQR